ncbi:MAG: cyclic nucleotide-binding domain-containing protein [bacterium]|nr:cyclic nucleotide-binding domain-containing protein [bacterium]MDT8367168.1 cyclic nucleotide-binding domain-containing protein [bacterium]
MSERSADVHGEHVEHSSFDSNHSGADLLGREYAHGEAIFREGDMDNAIYIVQTGKVRLVTTLPNGREVEIAAVGPGEAFGIAALADDKIMPRYATATADGRTSILQIDRTRLIRAIYDDASLIFSIFQAMSRRARTLTERLVTCESIHGEDPPEPSE